MNTTIKSKTALIKFFALILLAIPSVPAFAAHPLVSDDAGTLGKGNIQIELNGDIGTDKESDAGSTTKKNISQIATTFGTGVTDKVDVTVGFTRPWGSGDTDRKYFNNPGSVDLNINMKWQIYEHEGFSIAVKPQLGYSYGINVPENDYSMSYSLGLIFSKEFGAFALHLNTGYTYIDYNLPSVNDINRNSIWNCSLAATYDVVKDLKLITDFGFATNSNRSSNEMPAFALVGAIYNINKHIDLSTGLKTGLTKPEDDLTGTFGITVKF